MSRSLEEALKCPMQNVEDNFYWFEEIAEILLNETKLIINKEDYQILEIEFYLNSEKLNHKDPFTHSKHSKHSKKRQETCNEWYFHKTGRGGLDITFGENLGCGGILIRSIKCNTCEQIINGPKKIQDLILNKTKSSKINLEKYKVSGDEKGYSKFENINQICIKPISPQECDKVLSTVRVGLTLDGTKNKEKYIKKRYRFVNKGSLKAIGNIWNSVIAMHQDGEDNHNISEATGRSEDKIKKDIDYYENGKKIKIGEISKNSLNWEEFCNMLGTK